ncbi:MAG: peptidoglycan-binding domain-containing protein [Candidatus Paceibacterota bacterium]
MSKLLKSKFLLGALIVTVLVVGGVAFIGADTASADCTLTATLRVGSTGDEVKCLQAVVGATADGKFGPMTKTSVMAWQANNGLVADGVVGAKSRAVFNAGGAVSGNFPAGCTSAAGYSSTTGLACAALPATGPCTGGALFNSATGAACSVATSTVPGCAVGALFSATTGASCTVAPITSTGEGSIALSYAPVPGNTTLVYKGQNNQAFIGLQMKATGSDMKVSRLWLNFDQRIWLAANNISLWDGSTQLATIALSSSTVIEYTTGSEWQVQFNGLNVVVPVGTTKTLTAKFDRPLLTQDLTGATATNMTANSSIRTTDGSGYSEAVTLTARVINFVTSASTTGVETAQLSATSPATGIVSGLSATAGTLTDVKVTDFDLKATQSDLKVTKVVGVVNSSAATLKNMVASVQLRDASGAILAQAAPAPATTASGSTSSSGVAYTCGAYTTTLSCYQFDSLNISILKDTTTKLSIWVQMNPVGTPGAGYTTSGTGISANVTVSAAGIVTTDANYNAITPTGTVTGNYQYMYQYGPAIAYTGSSTPVVTTPDSSSTAQQMTGTMSFSVTANGEDKYLSATPADGTTGIFLEQQVANGTPATTVYTLSQLSTTSSDAVYGTTSGVYKIPAGTTKNFVTSYKITVATANGYNGAKLKTFMLTNNVDGSTDAVDYAYALPTAVGPQAYINK